MSVTERNEEVELLFERLSKLEVELTMLPELYARLDQTLIELEITRGELNALRRENERIGEVVESMSGSLSWRLTSPLRNLKMLFRR